MSENKKHIEGHDSAVQHVTGESIFINDIDAGEKMLIGYVVYSKQASAKIEPIDFQKALRMPGIHTILDCKDIPGENQMGPVIKDEPCLADGEVEFIGQAILLIAAESIEAARKAEEKINIKYLPKKAILSIEEAMKNNNLLDAPRQIATGNTEKAFTACDHILEGTLFSGPQEHWYLETQTALAIPIEGKEVLLHSSTQHPSETQEIISHVLGISKNRIAVEVKRLGGAFGGKETQGNHVAAWAALLAWKSGRPVKIHLDRDTDQIITGKRHPFLSNYKIGFTSKGKILAFDVDLHADAGANTDLSFAILERALFHIDNAYFIPNLKVSGTAWKTNKPSNTAFRGFGAPQGMAVIEQAIDRVARFVKKDAAEIRKLNFYGEKDNNITHYGEAVENNRLHKLWDRLHQEVDYHKKREAVNAFNKANTYQKRGLALSPVKFGISFTTSFLNQAGALVNIYTDGSVLVNHGGVEMGQGLHAKIRRIAALELNIDESKVRVSATCTDKVPNTSATAASSGADLNGMAVKNACDKLKSRLAEVYKEGMSFTENVKAAYAERISLSATGFYRTPDIHFDREQGRGRPFHYFAFGMAVSEVVVDILSGQVSIISTHIVHDVGDSLHPDLDLGQIRGGFIQGLGWCTSEEIKYDKDGSVLNHSPDTYKIPTICDIPQAFHVALLDHVPNPNTIRKSKAVGEPPFMLAFSVWLAIKDAISACTDHKKEPEYSLPATNEVILHSIEKLLANKGTK